MILVTWETDSCDRNCECFSNMNDANNFVEQNSLFETMTNTTYFTVKEIIQQVA